MECRFETARPGLIVIGLPDGRSVEARSEAPGLFTMKLPPAPEYEIRFLSGEHRLLLDTQRNYSRSTFNSSSLEGEWLMRLITPAAPET